MNDQQFEQAISRFEQEFSNGNCPEIQEFAESLGNDSTELFAELIHTELELNIRAGRNTRVEDYLNSYPQINEDKHLTGELIQTEFKIRRLFEPGLRIEEYEKRFPEFYPQILKLASANISTSPNGSDTIASRPYPQISFSDSNSRFRKVRLHEHGGLGNVWRANDSELNRLVAVKEIKPKYSSSHSHRSRFAREIIATCRLEHPGIVPVYGLGYLGDGTPYFAMQFIDGSNFKHAIEKFFQTQSKNSPKNSIDFRRLIQHFLDVCNTIHYAHTQGVVHRDIKPGNIMIGRFGETYVVDWGLAKTLESSSNKSVLPNNGTSYQQMVSESDNSDSLAGTMIGSPGFMSPEQLAGDLGNIGPASDVYSLGATLLALISGGQQPDTTSLSGVSIEGKLDYSKIHASLKPLASVCEKAMATEPESRYTTAKLVADDVERFLLDEHVLAHQESSAEKWNRFSRKNRGILNTLLAAFALLATLATITAFWINSERESAIAAKGSEAKQRKRVELALQGNQQRTRQLTKITKIFADLFSGPDDSELCLDLESITLQQALARLKEEIGNYDDPIVRSFLFAVVARNNKAKGNYKTANEDFENSIELLSESGIPEDDPLFVDVLNGYCSTKIAVGDFNDAKTIAKKIEAVCAENPELDFQHYKVILTQIPMFLRRREFLIAQEKLKKALVLSNRLYADDKTSNNYLWGQYTHASVKRLTGDLNAAQRLFRNVIDTLDDKNQLHPLGISSQVQLAEMSFFAGKKNEAENMVEEALNKSKQHFGDMHTDTIEIQNRLGTILALADDNKKRKRGLKLLKETRQFQLSNFETMAYDALGTTCLIIRVLNGRADADAFRDAIKIGEEMIEQVKSSEIETSGLSNLMYSLTNLLSESYIKSNQFEQAVATLKKARSQALAAFGEDSKEEIAVRKKLSRIEKMQAANQEK